MITPAQIEKRLFDLSKEIDEAQASLEIAEMEFALSTADYEIAMAETRIELDDAKMTVQKKQDMALIKNKDGYRRQVKSEAIVKIARSLIRKIEKQVDITRSISSSIKSSMEL
jgi:thermostable 8-oxoguanine DNA glycosylase